MLTDIAQQEDIDHLQVKSYDPNSMYSRIAYHAASFLTGRVRTVQIKRTNVNYAYDRKRLGSRATRSSLMAFKCRYLAFEHQEELVLHGLSEISGVLVVLLWRWTWDVKKKAWVMVHANVAEDDDDDGESRNNGSDEEDSIDRNDLSSPSGSEDRNLSLEHWANMRSRISSISRDMGAPVVRHLVAGKESG